MDGVGISISDRECLTDDGLDKDFNCLSLIVSGPDGKPISNGETGEAIEGQTITLDAQLFDDGEALSSTGIEWDVFLNGNCCINGVESTGETVSIQIPILDDFDNDYILVSVLGKKSDNIDIGKSIRILIKSEESVAEAAAIEVSQNIANFQYTRANQLLSLQPDLTCRFDDSCAGSLALNVANGKADVAFRSGSKGAFWSELTASITTEGTVESDYALFALGYDRKVNKNLLLGALFEYDYAHSQFDGAEIKGTGYLVGPYFVYQSDGGKLKLDGRALIGASTNAYTSDAGIDQDFTTTRALITLGLESEIDMGNGLTLRPRFQGGYAKDSLDEFEIVIGSASAAIQANTIEIWQTTASLNFNKEIAVSQGSMAIFGGVSAIGSKSEGTGSAMGFVPAFENYRGKLELGLSRQMNDNLSFQIKGGYDGIGQENYASKSVTFGLDYSF